MPRTTGRGLDEPALSRGGGCSGVLTVINLWVTLCDWDVVATCSERGDCPVLDFLLALGGSLARQATKMLALLQRVATSGPPTNTELSHKIAGEIWEFLHGDLRILWFYDEGRLVICATAFVKKSRRTPRAEIDRAEAERMRYVAAKARGTTHFDEGPP